MSDKKLVSITGGKEEEIYINPEALDALSGVAEWIKEIGCSEIQIVVLSGCMTYSEVYNTTTVSETMGGAIRKYEARYQRELDAEYWEEDCDE